MIQQSINQAMSIAGILASQNPTLQRLHKEREEKAEIRSEIESGRKYRKGVGESIRKLSEEYRKAEKELTEAGEGVPAEIGLSYQEKMDRLVKDYAENLRRQGELEESELMVSPTEKTYGEIDKLRERYESRIGRLEKKYGDFTGAERQMEEESRMAQEEEEENARIAEEESRTAAAEEARKKAEEAQKAEQERLRQARMSMFGVVDKPNYGVRSFENYGRID